MNYRNVPVNASFIAGGIFTLPTPAFKRRGIETDVPTAVQ